MFRLGQDPLHTAAGWQGATLGGKQTVTVTLKPEQVAALEALLAHCNARGLPMSAITRADFTHPALDATLAALEAEVMRGRALVVLRGLPVQRHSDEDVAKLFWGIGTHLGTGHSQSARGDLMGFVQDETAADGRQSARGYLSRRELSLHSDITALMALLCVRPAMQGGESALVSAEAIYNIVLAEHPEYMPVYLRGFPYHRRGEEAPDAEPITPYDVPIFSECEGRLSCFYLRTVLDAALRALGRVLTPLERDAIAFFEAVTLRPEVQLRFMLEPGEAVFVDNHQVLHARTVFEDFPAPAPRRLMLRLWLQPHRPRPVVPEMFLYRNRSGGPGIDKQEGRVPAGNDFLIPRVALATLPPMARP